MWIKREFQWREDDNGMHGWMLKDMPHFDSGSGLTIAHDTLEHFDNGSDIEDEFQAFGSILYGRACGGYWSLVTTWANPADSLASDLIRFLSDYISDGKTVRSCAARKLDNDDGSEDILQSVGARVLRDIRDELVMRDGADISEHDLRGEVHNMLQWMRRGYRRAARRWSNWNGAQVASMFYEIEHEIDRDFNGGEDEGGYHYHDVLKVSFSPKRMDYKITLDAYKDPHDR